MAKGRPTTLAICSISTGTLRNDDLIPAMLYELRRIRLTRKERAEVERIHRNLEKENYWDEAEEYGGADDDLESLYEIADNHTPDYCRFGAHEGDGANVGVWVDWDAIEQDKTRDKADGSTSFAGEIAASREDNLGERYALESNDHGNTTLWRRAGNRWVECWSVV